MNLQGTPDHINNTLLLSWDPPSGTPPEEYRVYVNGLLVAEIPDTSTVLAAADLIMAIEVTAVNGGIESAPAVLVFTGTLWPGCSLFHLVGIFYDPNALPPILITENITPCLPGSEIYGHPVDCAVRSLTTTCA